jgi:carbon monoxide dehydrogenase subunit G
MTLSSGSASIVINRPPADVWAAVADITRMGEWSPECVRARWIGGSSGPAEGAEFEGDNVAKLGPIALKKWTTTSKVTVCEVGRTFEFVASGLTTWRYDFEASGSGTKVTEFFRFEESGFAGFFYGKVLQRGKTMTKGMAQTLARIKAALERS